MKTKAEPVTEDGKVVGYRISGNKQWISNGGVADVYTVLAKAPGGPSWFIVEKDAEGFTRDRDEDKHGIRLSNTAPLGFHRTFVPAENLIQVGTHLVHVEQAGQGDAVICLHGIRASGYAWRHIMPGLSQRYRVIAPDMHGHGFSDRPIEAQAYSLQGQSRLLLGLMDADEVPYENHAPAKGSPRKQT